MTDFAVELKTRLKSIADVTALVGTANDARIYPDMLRQGCSLPAIVFWESGGDSEQELGSISGLVRSVWHIVAYGATRGASNGLAEAIRTKALNSNYTGLFGTTWVDGINCSSHRAWGFDPARDNSETPRYWCERVYDIWHQEDRT